MKRLLAAGGQAIYQVSRVFRREEIGPLHNPEFTMVEWYRTGDGMSEGMQLTSDLCETLLRPRPRRTRSAMDEHSGNHVGRRSAHGRRSRLAAAARACGIEPPASLDADGPRRLARSVAGRAGPAAPGRRAAGAHIRLSGQPGGVGPRPTRCPPRGRTLRVVRRRHRAGQRLPRAARSG